MAQVEAVVLETDGSFTALRKAGSVECPALQSHGTGGDRRRGEAPRRELAGG